VANTLITPDWITKETMRLATNNLKFVGNIDRSYDDQYVQAGAKVGATVKIRLPQRFRTTKGQALQVQSINDQYVPASITDQAHVDMSFSSADLTLSVDSFRERYVKPAGEQLANTMDYDGLSRCYVDVYNSVGTPGTTPSANLTYLQAGVKMTNAAAPVAGRKAVLDALAHATIANANLTLFNPGKTISDVYRSGMFAAEALGVAEWYMDQNVASHTTGAFTSSTPVVNGANQTGSSLITSGWASGATTLKRGDVFTIANVYAVNPQNYQSTGALQQFVVTADAADTTGAITLSISPSIITSGQLQTVSASPAASASILVVGQTGATGTLTATASPQNLIFLKEAFAMVSADLDMPQGGAKSSRISSNKLGFSMRFVEQYNIQTDQNAARIDVLYGFKTLRPEFACRVWG
jgi:hypothetical protein